MKKEDEANQVLAPFSTCSFPARVLELAGKDWRWVCGTWADRSPIEVSQLGY